MVNFQLTVQRSSLCHTVSYHLTSCYVCFIFYSTDSPDILSISPSNPVVVANGAHAQVSCNMSGIPRPDIEWCINGTCDSNWASFERYSVINIPSDVNDTTYLNTFQITSAREEDNGPITCRLKSNQTNNMTTEFFVLCKY